MWFNNGKKNKEMSDIMKNKHIDILLSFLNTPLDSGDEIFARFAALPNAVDRSGAEPLQRYVYIPGTRKDRVLLVAHIDTVWDRAYKRPFSEAHEVLFEDGVFRSGNAACGIGADCRAGCAMLWEMRGSGHSILIVDGEEHGKHGAKYLKKSNSVLFRTLNHHRYIIEFDWQGTDGCLFNQVDNTKRFKKYIENALGFIDSKAKGGTDLQVLCQRVCGVNLGVGYHKCHTKDETLVLSEWENTLEKVGAFLEQPQPKFRSLFFPKYIRFAKYGVNKVLRILKLKK